MTSSSGHSEESSAAERALAEFLRLLETDEKPDFEAFCAKRTEIANELRRLYGKLCALSEELRGNPRPPCLTEQIKQIHGLGVNPEITLDALPNEMEAESSSELLKKLGAHTATQTRYHLKGEVARGGMGVILKAWDEDLRRNLAMKVILGTSGDDATGDTPAIDPAKLSRFLEEAQVTGQLEHPGIVPVHELGLDTRGRVYFTMRLVKGRPLNEVFDDVTTGEDSWSVTRALSVILDICEAMAFAHDKGVIHRDLKPANVMVGKYGETYVMDWGLARVLGQTDRHDIRPREAEPVKSAEVMTDRRTETPGQTDSPLLTRDGTVLGTPAYMPPEQALGKLEEVGSAADVYAVGAILYHLLTGAAPYSEPGARLSPHTLLALVIQGPPRAVHELNRAIPAALEAVCEKAMARRIADRYPSMEALAADLRAYMEDRVVAAYESGPIAELRKWIVRNKGITATAVAAVVLIAALTSWFVVSVTAQEQEARRNEEIALREKNRADQNASLATEKVREAKAARQRLLPLTDIKTLAYLKLSMNTLWPAVPQKVTAMERWLEEAKEVTGNLSMHEQTLADLRSLGVQEAHPRDAELADLRNRAAKPSEEQTQREAGLITLEAQIESLEAMIERERPYRFPDEQDTWWHDTLVSLLSQLVAFSANDPFGETVASVEKRLKFSKTIRKNSITYYQDDWDNAIASIGNPAEFPQYGGLELPEQLGLVPIGRDPESGLWEFWHVHTGERPQRDEVGRIVVREGIGLVFVLIPGESFWMGAQAIDPKGRNYDPQAERRESDNGSPVQVTLDAFFLSKYEMTQGQWKRFTGENPSHWFLKYPSSSGPLYPVEQVSWEDCDQVLSRMGLNLPTEAQWEHACRAGMQTPWNSGPDAASLAEYANIADAAYGQMFPTAPAFEEFDDGLGPPSAVGTLNANRFGLFDMHGNVFEWCRDAYGSYALPAAPGDGGHLVHGASEHVLRGGSFSLPAIYARSAYRLKITPSLRMNNMGARPAKAIDP